VTVLDRMKCVVDSKRFRSAKHRRERLSSCERVHRLAAFAIHVDREAGVGGEERLLTLGVATVGAMGPRVHQLADREAVGRLLG